MALKITLTESDSKIESKILKALSEEINNAWPKKINLVKDIFSRNSYDSVLNCPEMDSVTNGILRIDFGITFNPAAAIANAVAQSVSVVFDKVNSKITSGGFKVTVQPLDYLNVLSLPQSVVVTEKGASLPWLDWLLTYGDSIIIANFGVKYSTGKGRTGGGYMISPARPFQVNSAFSGTVDNNFITRAIINKLPDIENDLIKALT